MKMLIVLSLLIGSTAFANRESGGRAGANAVFVKFDSYGTGIDSKTYARTSKFIAVASENERVVAKSEEQKGHEGERVVCVQFKNTSDRLKLIQKIAPGILKDRKSTPVERTSVFVAVDCSDISKATEQDLEAYVKRGNQ